ncbi:MAG TPA: bacteriohemerythrin [Bacteroidales bacterium]|nr:bacteriohemerythrin [Bacteroidales bacterium]
MEFITWRDSYSVKVPSIDDQHKKLIGLINNLYTKFYEGLKKGDLETIFSELEQYAVYHFNYEERFMKLYGFKGFKEHQKEHESFREKIEEYKKNLDPQNNSQILDLVGFLKNWLLKHIMGTDRKYSDLFQKKGLK